MIKFKWFYDVLRLCSQILLRFLISACCILDPGDTSSVSYLFWSSSVDWVVQLLWCCRWISIFSEHIKEFSNSILWWGAFVMMESFRQLLMHLMLSLVHLLDVMDDFHKSIFYASAGKRCGIYTLIMMKFHTNVSWEKMIKWWHFRSKVNFTVIPWC